jgi:hypothetical protein
LQFIYQSYLVIENPTTDDDVDGDEDDIDIDDFLKVFATGPYILLILVLVLNSSLVLVFVWGL